MSSCTGGTRWHHQEVISACPQEKPPKPASAIFPNSVNGDPVFSLLLPKHHSRLLLEPTAIPSAGLTTLPSKCVWSVTPSLHSCCFHSGPDYRHLSPSFIPVASSLVSALTFLPLLSVFHKVQEIFLKNHFSIWQNQYNIVKFKNKIKFKFKLLPAPQKKSQTIPILPLLLFFKI